MFNMRRELTVIERTGETPYLLTWSGRGARIQIAYFSAYLAAMNKLEALHELGVEARLYAELTIEAYRRERIEEPMPPGMSRRVSLIPSVE